MTPKQLFRNLSNQKINRVLMRHSDSSRPYLSVFPFGDSFNEPSRSLDAVYWILPTRLIRACLRHDPAGQSPYSP